MITFTPAEQTQIDDMVARIESGAINRDLFVKSTDRLSRRYNGNMSESRRRELIARQVVECRTK